MMAAPMLYRTYEPDLQVRARADGGDGRTVHGIAVPYEIPQRINSHLVEQFARGAFDHQLDRPGRVRFAREHVELGGQLIGVATLLRDDPAGLYVELRTANTPAGDETLELVKVGALPHLSIGFREGRNRRLPSGATERVTADLREVVATMQGAFGDAAAVGGIRDEAGSQLSGHPVGVEFCPECPHCTVPSGLAVAAQVRSALPTLPAALV